MRKVIVDEKIIRKRMIDKNIKSITELAKSAGISKPTIYEFLNGKSPYSALFIRLCDFLELEPKELLIDIEDKERNNV